MKKLLLILMLTACAQTFAQQDALYSQYMFNPFAVNPAYAGSRNSYSAVVLQRFQWVGIDDSPMTSSFAVHAPTTKWNLVWGVGAVLDRLGPTQSTNISGTIGYQLKVRKQSKLTFALRGGSYSFGIDRSKLVFKDPTDQLNVNVGIERTTIPTFDFGAYYYTPKFYAGLSINHLNGGQIAFKDLNIDNTGLFLRQHLFLSSGYVFDLNSNIIMKPSVLVKYARGAPVNIDANFSTLFYKKVWLGVSLRNVSSLVLMTDINITDFMRLGYAYDISLNKLSAYNSGSHELFIGFDFNLKKSNTVSPRYL
ncbi:MAG: type IX secretion system membrane protein PorP/SprF [Flavobacteriales bacterium]|nr:type IX secretion system membrane protein PorP/SprF [Flavobacteriales bacterium]